MFDFKLYLFFLHRCIYGRQHINLNIGSSYLVVLEALFEQYVQLEVLLTVQLYILQQKFKVIAFIKYDKMVSTPEC